MTDDPAAALLDAVLQPRASGALARINEACAAGADPNAVTPATSTASGPVRAGHTLLTWSVHEGASRAVAKLLEGGADPNLVDPNGWSPWMASTLTDEPARSRIQDALLAHGGRPHGESIGDIVRAIFRGDLEQASRLVTAPDDLRPLSHLRVDLLQRQIAQDDEAMVRFLLAHGVQANESHLASAVRSGRLAILDTLLASGLRLHDTGQEETLLMAAAQAGHLAVVQRLVAAGVDVDRTAHGNVLWTASFFARRAGHGEVAAWLEARMDPALRRAQTSLLERVDPRFRPLFEQATAGDGVPTQEIVAALSRWDAAVGVSVSDVAPDALTVRFGAVPPAGDPLYAEVLRLCPAAGTSADSLRASLARDPRLTLWWD